MAIRLRKGAAALTGCLLFASAAFAESAFHPNEIKYKDSGVKPATGRSGSASIEARALFGKDNVTTIEVSTAAPGNLDRVQVKRTAAEITHNFNALAGGAFTTASSDFGPGEPLQIQANVSGIDPARIDVVTADTMVARRPDLTVAAIHAAPHAVAGSPERIVAVVRELNGDSGARASCVLRAAGAELDRADNIWVDAGGTVSCTFATSFPTAGDTSFSVHVENVNPGDWDGANNSASGSIKVYGSAEPFASWTASTWHSDYVHHHRTDAYWGQLEAHETGWQGASMRRGYIFDAVDIPNLRVSTWESTDGELIHESLDAPLNISGEGWWGGGRCGFGWHDHQMIELCEVTDFHSPRYMWIEAWRNAGDVTYHSKGWAWTHSFPGPFYTWNTVDRTTWGSQKTLGSSYEFRLVVSDGQKLWEAAAALPVTTRPGGYTLQMCFGSPGFQTCYDISHSSIDKTASGSGW